MISEQQLLNGVRLTRKFTTVCTESHQQSWQHPLTIPLRYDCLCLCKPSSAGKSEPSNRLDARSEEAEPRSQRSSSFSCNADLWRPFGTSKYKANAFLPVSRTSQVILGLVCKSSLGRMLRSNTSLGLDAFTDLVCAGIVSKCPFSSTSLDVQDSRAALKTTSTLAVLSAIIEKMNCYFDELR